MESAGDRHDQDRQHSEDPVEGGQSDFPDTPREHSQDPAEGPDEAAAEEVTPGA